MSGCSCGQAGSMFCDSCHDYSCRSNPNYYGVEPSSYEDEKIPEDFYKENNLEHLKGVKAPDIPMIKDEQELKDETDETIRKIWDNFLI